MQLLRSETSYGSESCRTLLLASVDASLLCLVLRAGANSHALPSQASCQGRLKWWIGKKRCREVLFFETLRICRICSRKRRSTLSRNLRSEYGAHHYLQGSRAQHCSAITCLSVKSRRRRRLGLGKLAGGCFLTEFEGRRRSCLFAIALPGAQQRHVTLP